MNHAGWLALGTMVCSSVFVTLQAETPKEFQEQEKLIVKLFKAYNSDDVKAVFEDYIEGFKAAGAQTLWDALYKANKEKYGKYKSHKFVNSGSVASDGLTIFRMDVEFEKEKNVHVVVNFSQEGKSWKIQQL
nr:hypothetical protein [Gemmatales bacterium]